MKRTPTGTSVGVDDPYAVVERCDYLTDAGTCRYAFEHGQHDPAFASERAAKEYACLALTDDDDPDWDACPHFRARNHDHECVRCGLAEKRMAHDDDRPLLEEHHLSYADGESTTHEITVCLCRWCHAKVHGSWARIDDKVAPDPAAIAALEGRRSREIDELGFDSAADRYDLD